MKSRKEKLDELELFDVHPKVSKTKKIIGWVIFILTVISVVILAIVSGMISYQEALETGVSGIPLTLEYGLILFISTLISLAIIFAIAFAFFWKPMQNHLTERKKNIEENILEASYTRKIAESEYAKLVIKNKNAATDAKNLIEQSKEIANKEKKSILDKTKFEQDQLIEKTRIQIEREKEQLKNEIKSEIVSTSILAAEKILEKELDKSSNEKMVNELLNLIK